MDKLKPCPFCDSDAEVYQPQITLGCDDEDINYLRVICTNHKCRTAGGLVRFTNFNRQSDDYQSARQAVITAWNTRKAEHD